MDEIGLGKRLQAARQAAGLTQQGLCQKANLSYSTLAKIERGAIRSPSIFTIQNIAAAVGLTLDELIGVAKPVAAPEKQRQRSKSGIGFVYFDVNGCLVRFLHRAFTKLAADTNQTIDVVENVFLNYNDAACRGEMSMAEFNASLAKGLHVTNVDWPSYYLEAVEPITEMHELLDWTCQWYGVGLLTNIMPGLVASLKQRVLIPDVPYDVTVDSSDVHATKPEKAIYEVAMERAVCPPNEILLIDDEKSNLMAAEKMGWRVLWFDVYCPEETITQIRSLLELSDAALVPDADSLPSGVASDMAGQASSVVESAAPMQPADFFASDHRREQTYPSA